MVTSTYRGGLGNQLFQVAAGYALAADNGDTYAINPWNQVERGQGYGIIRYIDTIFKQFPKTRFSSLQYHREPQFNYLPIPYRPDIVLDGYFQTVKYFENHKNQLIELFDVCDLSSVPNSCAIHVRTGDYIGQSSFDMVTPLYFRRAMDYVRRISPNTQFRLVTDNVEMALRYLSPNIRYDIPDGTELSDLGVMAFSDFVITSNSSFSWWGSFLGKPKITVSPREWFARRRDSFSDVHRSDMVLLPTR